jgi:hypothetical protein
MFDSIIAYCWTRDRFGNVWPKIDFEKQPNFYDKIPIVKHQDYFLASCMFFDKNKHDSFVLKHYKRWCNKHDHLAFFGKDRKRKVQVDGFEFKSKSIPMNLNIIPEVWFYFESDNISEIKRLIDNHLVGINKYVGHGYGFFDSYKIEQENKMDFRRDALRPIPLNGGSTLNKNIQYAAYRIPYHTTERVLCEVPECY